MIIRFPSRTPFSETSVTYYQREGGRFALVANVTLAYDGFCISGIDLCNAVYNRTPRCDLPRFRVYAHNDSAPAAGSRPQRPYYVPLYYFPPDPDFSF